MRFFDSGPSWRSPILGYALSALLAAGCGGSSGSNRVVVHGKVQQAGKPLDAGTITFLPVEGHKGPSASTLIASGTFNFTQEDGPVPGPHRVQINVSPNQKKLPGPPGSSAPAAKSDWNYEVTVPDQGPFERDFELE